MTFETVVAEVNARGLQVHRLYQNADGRWSANLTDRFDYWAPAGGDTAAEAIRAALAAVPEKPKGLSLGDLL